MHQALICLVRHSPRAYPELTCLVRGGDLTAAAYVLAQISPQTQYFIQTS